MNTSRVSTYARRVHEQMLIMQRKLRRTRLEFPFLIGAQESIVLMLLASNSGLNGERLARSCGVHPSTISRLLTYLETQGYVERAENSLDRRAQQLRFTEKGFALRRDLEIHSRMLSDRDFAGLSDKENETLAGYLDRIASGLGAPVDTRQAGDHITEAPRRRLTMKLGLAGREYCKSGFDIAEYQLLWDLFRSSKPRRPAEVIRDLPFDRTKLSKFLSKLERIGWTKRDSIDGKIVNTIRLTKIGREQIARIEIKVNDFLLPGLNAFTEPELRDVIHLLSKAALPALPEATARATILVCRSERSRKRARGMLVRQFVLRDLAHDLPSDLADRKAFVAIAVINGVPGAVLEAHVRSARATVRWFFATDEVLSRSAGHRLVRAMLRRHPGIRRIDFAQSARELALQLQSSGLRAAGHPVVIG